MKDTSLLVWLTQLGVSVAVPPVGFILLALWLRDRHCWGNWVIWVGVILGVFGAAEGLRTSLKALTLLDKKQNKEQTVSYNDHA